MIVSHLPVSIDYITNAKEKINEKTLDIRT